MTTYTEIHAQRLEAFWSSLEARGAILILDDNTAYKGDVLKTVLENEIAAAGLALRKDYESKRPRPPRSTHHSNKMDAARVLTIKNLLAQRGPRLSSTEIGLMVGVKDARVTEVNNGMWDHLLPAYLAPTAQKKTKR